jgi:hypothetical protein
MEEVAGELEEVVKSLPSDAVNHLFSLGVRSFIPNY